MAPGSFCTSYAVGLVAIFASIPLWSKLQETPASSTGTMVFPRQHTVRQGRSAIVIGATGATGRQVIKELLNNDSWARVTSVGRRPALADERHPKLTDVLVEDMHSQLPSTLDKWRGHDVVFNCIGTTRGSAGGAAQFVAVEVGITSAVAKLAAEAGIGHVSMVSSQGANHKQWATDMIHPLLYVRTLGEKEQAVLQQEGIRRVSIFRPGPLNRLMGDRMHENVLNFFGVGLRVDELARAMVRDAESEPPQDKEEPVVYENAEILKLAASCHN